MCFSRHASSRSARNTPCRNTWAQVLALIIFTCSPSADASLLTINLDDQVLAQSFAIGHSTFRIRPFLPSRELPAMGNDQQEPPASKLLTDPTDPGKKRAKDIDGDRVLCASKSTPYILKTHDPTLRAHRRSYVTFLERLHQPYRTGRKRSRMLPPADPVSEQDGKSDTMMNVSLTNGVCPSDSC